MSLFLNLSHTQHISTKRMFLFCQYSPSKSFSSSLKPIKLKNIYFCKASQCHLLPFSGFSQTKQRHFMVRKHSSCFLNSYSLIFSFSLKLCSDFSPFIISTLINIHFFIIFQSIKFLFWFQTDSCLYPNSTTWKWVKSQIL